MHSLIAKSLTTAVATTTRVPAVWSVAARRFASTEASREVTPVSEQAVAPVDAVSGAPGNCSQADVIQLELTA